MNTTAHILTLAAVVALGFGCAAENIGDGSGAVRVTTQCSVVGSGTMPAGDAFDGAATGTPDGFASGTWEHLGPELPAADADEPGEGCRGVRRGHEEGRGEGHDRHQGRGLGHECGCGDDDGSTRDRLVGDVEAVTCFINGSRVGVLEGSGEWNGVAGHTFEVTIVDGGSSDDYSLSVYDAAGALVYDASGMPDSGDITLTEL